MKLTRSKESWRRVSCSPSPPNSTSWWATSPRSRTACTGMPCTRAERRRSEAVASGGDQMRGGRRNAGASTLSGWCTRPSIGVEARPPQSGTSSLEMARIARGAINPPPPGAWSPRANPRQLRCSAGAATVVRAVDARCPARRRDRELRACRRVTELVRGVADRPGPGGARAATVWPIRPSAPMTATLICGPGIAFMPGTKPHRSRREHAGWDRRRRWRRLAATARLPRLAGDAVRYLSRRPARAETRAGRTRSGAVPVNPPQRLEVLASRRGCRRGPCPGGGQGGPGMHMPSSKTRSGHSGGTWQIDPIASRGSEVSMHEHHFSLSPVQWQNPPRRHNARVPTWSARRTAT